MDNLEKVEKLRERANVSYEEARAALEENNWDMLDAMVSLEKKGRVNGPKQSQYTTSYDQQEEYASVKETVYEEKDKKKGRKDGTVGSFVRKFFRICRDNSFCVNRHGELVFKFPVILLVIVAIWTWKVILPLLIVGLFFNFRYSFEGKDDLKEANQFMETAGQTVDRVKEEFVKNKEE